MKGDSAAQRERHRQSEHCRAQVRVIADDQSHADDRENDRHENDSRCRDGVQIHGYGDVRHGVDGIHKEVKDENHSRHFDVSTVSGRRDISHGVRRFVGLGQGVRSG